MKHDAIFYNSLLDALEDDLEEQEMLLAKTKLLGIPAIDDAAALEREFTELERSNKIKSEARNKDLQAKKDLKAQLPKEYYEIVRRDVSS